MIQFEQTVIDFLKIWMPYIIVCFSAGMTWQSLKDTNKKQSEDILVVSKRLNNLEEAEKGYRKYIPIAESNVKRIEVLECDNKRIEISLAKIESHLAGIETNILWLKEDIIKRNK